MAEPIGSYSESIEESPQLHHEGPPYDVEIEASDAVRCKDGIQINGSHLQAFDGRLHNARNSKVFGIIIYRCRQASAYYIDRKYAAFYLKDQLM